MQFRHTLCRDDEDFKVEVEGEYEDADPGDVGDWPGQRGSPSYEACFIVESVKLNGKEIDCTDDEIERLAEEAMRLGRR